MKMTDFSGQPLQKYVDEGLQLELFFLVPG